MNDKLKFSAINYDFLFEEEIKERDNLLFHEANSPNKWRGWVDSVDENNINCKIVRIHDVTKHLVIDKSVLSDDVITDFFENILTMVAIYEITLQRFVYKIICFIFVKQFKKGI